MTLPIAYAGEPGAFAEDAAIAAFGDVPRRPVGSTPVFTQPMSEPLAVLSQDWLLPGLERVPGDSVAMLEPNQRFIEAFMLGLNVEMGRELLWRDFAVDNPSATFFRRFWRTVSPKTDGDIAPIAEWGVHKLTENKAAGSPGKQVVLGWSVDLRCYRVAQFHLAGAAQLHLARFSEKHPRP